MNICIYCKNDAKVAVFDSEEHIFPFALGNSDKKLILPKGVVCTYCNTSLGKIDAELLDFLPVKATRLLHNIRNRKGNVPVVKTANSLEIERINNAIHFQVPRRVFKNLSSSLNGPIFKLEVRAAKSSKDKNRTLSRSLNKILFGALTKKFGVKWALETNNDLLRNFILKDECTGLYGEIFVTTVNHLGLSSFEVQWMNAPLYTVRIHNVIFHFRLYNNINGRGCIKSSRSGANPMTLYW